MPEQNGWNEWSKHVLHELERLHESNKGIMEEVQNLKSDINRDLATRPEVTEVKKELSETRLNHSIAIEQIKAELKFKAGTWGALAGLIPVVLSLLLWVVSRLYGG